LAAGAVDEVAVAGARPAVLMISKLIANGLAAACVQALSLSRTA
jgi:hypothetical protein